MEAWTTIRYLRAQGKSIRAVAREVSVSRNTLRAALRQEHPPQYQRPRRPNPKLGPYLAQIEDMLTEKHFIGTRILRELRKVAYDGGRTALYDHLRTLKGELVDPRVCPGAAPTLTCIIGRVSPFLMGNTRLPPTVVARSSLSHIPAPPPKPATSFGCPRPRPSLDGKPRSRIMRFSVRGTDTSGTG